MKRSVLFGVFLALLVVTVAFAQGKPNFSGTWTPPAPAAGAGGGGRGMGGGPMTVTQNDKTLTVERTMGQNTVKTTYNLDGTEAKNEQPGRGGTMTVTTTAKWDGNKLSSPPRGRAEWPDGEDADLVADCRWQPPVEGQGRGGPTTTVYTKGSKRLARRDRDAELPCPDHHDPGRPATRRSALSARTPCLRLSQRSQQLPHRQSRHRIRQSGAISASGSSTKRALAEPRVRHARSGLVDALVPEQIRSRSSVRGAPGCGRSRPRSRSIARAASSSARGGPVECRRRRRRSGTSGCGPTTRPVGLEEAGHAEVW